MRVSFEGELDDVFKMVCEAYYEAKGDMFSQADGYSGPIDVPAGDQGGVKFGPQGSVIVNGLLRDVAQPVIGEIEGDEPEELLTAIAGFLCRLSQATGRSIDDVEVALDKDKTRFELVVVLGEGFNTDIADAITSDLLEVV